jgi:hypothetical protein
LWPFDHDAHGRTVAAARAALPPAEFDARWEEGRALPADAVFALAAEAPVVPRPGAADDAFAPADATRTRGRPA